MKKIVLLILSLMFISSIALADTGGSGNNSPISADDAAKLKSQLGALSQAMGNPPPTPPVVPSANPTEKTMTQVADKALDMVGGAVATLSQSLSKIAPQVWRIMIKQQYAKAIGGISTVLTMLLGTFIYMIVIRRFWKPVSEKAYSDLCTEDQVKYVFRSVVPTVAACLLTVIFAVQLGDSIQLLVNPEYYAVKDILLLITNPSQAPN